MPNYKTHSIHSELVLNNVKSRVNIRKDNLKKFAFGPDSLITTDYNLFDYQHSHNTRDYFETLLKIIKNNKYHDDSKVMSFLYGQLDHFALDLVMHPLIYYMTEDMTSKYMVKPHALIENWIDDYIMQKYNKKEENYYVNNSYMSEELKKTIDELYLKIYKRNKMSSKYIKGINNITGFDKVRFSKSKFLRNIAERLKIGNIFYNRDYARVVKYLNLEKENITNPVTGELCNDSFEDLWNKSIDISSELIEDANDYIYKDKELNNYYIKNNISYNTGLPCAEDEKFKYVKRYRK